MNWDQIVPAIFLTAVLILVLPAFLKTNFDGGRHLRRVKKI
jgi:ribose 5-phosphate isomerase RpiB